MHCLSQRVTGRRKAGALVPCFMEKLNFFLLNGLNNGREMYILSKLTLNDL